MCVPIRVTGVAERKGILNAEQRLVTEGNARAVRLVQRLPAAVSGRAYEALVVDNEVMNAAGAHDRDCVCDLLIQGALEQEVATLRNALDAPLMETIGAWTFWTGSIGKIKVVVSRTDEGTVNAAGATALGI